MVASLWAERAEKVRKSKVDIPMRTICWSLPTMGSWRWISGSLTPCCRTATPEKVAVCTDNILYKIWERTAEKSLRRWLFVDLSTPHNDGQFNVYDDLKKKLLDKGIPETEIAYIHDAKTEAAKKELFGKVRSGEIRVLIGSTQKMGAGTNAQRKLIALHHLDCP